MATPPTLADIFTRHSTAPHVDSARQREFWVTAGARQVLDKKPWLRKAHCWVLTFDQSVVLPVQEIAIQSSARASYVVNARFSLHVRCVREHAHAAVEHLAKHRDVQGFILTQLHQAVTQIQSEDRQRQCDPAVSVVEERDRWRDTLIERLGAATRLEVVVFVESDVKATLWETAEDGLNIYLSDSTDEVRLGFKLLTAPHRLGVAALYEDQHAQFRELVRRIATSWFVSSVGLHELVARTEQVRLRFLDQLRGTAAEYGRVVQFLSIRPSVQFEMPKIEPVLVDRSYGVASSNELLKVRHSLNFELVDIALFRKAQVTNAIDWATERLDHAARIALDSTEYLNVVVDFQTNVGSRMRELLDQSFAAAGCQVTSYRGKPLAEPTIYREDGFSFEFSDDNLSTSQAGVFVSISLVVTGKLLHLERIRDRLGPGVDLREHILKPAAREALRLEMHKISPEQFYMHFSRDSANSEFGSSQETLARAVAAALDKCGARCNVLIKQGHTVLAQRLTQLMAARPRVVVTVASRDGGEAAFEVVYRVMGVSPEKWIVFVRGPADPAQEIAEINELIDRAMQELLSYSFTSDLLLYQRPEGRKLLQSVIFDADHEIDGRVVPGGDLLRKITELHGLAVDVTTFRRTDTVFEERRKRDNKERTTTYFDAKSESRAHIKSQLDNLKQREIDILSEYSDAKDPELADIRGSVQRLEEKLLEVTDVAELRPVDLPRIARRSQAHEIDAWRETDGAATRDAQST